MIVICSPNAITSKWIPQEIAYFKSLGRSQHILPLLIEGSSSESIPKELSEDGQHPLAADVRPKEGEDDETRKHTALLRLIARLLNCNYDDLAQRDKGRFHITFTQKQYQQRLLDRQKNVQADIKKLQAEDSF